MNSSTIDVPIIIPSWVKIGRQEYKVEEESDILSETVESEIKYPMRNPGTENILENDEIMTSFS